MSYGLKTWSENGVVELDTSVFTYRVIHNKQYRLGGIYDGTVISVNIPEFTVANCVAAVLPISGVTEYADEAMPYIAVSNGSVVVRSRHPQESYNGIGSGIIFRLLIMRYKN